MKTIYMEITIGYMLLLGLQDEVQEILDHAVLKTTRNEIRYLIMKENEV